MRFEDELRASIAEEHLRSFITAAVEVDPREVEDDYRHSNTNYSVRWAEVEPEKLRDKVQVADPDLQAYFEGHKGDFKITTEQRRARYIFVDQNKAGAALQIPDDELKQVKEQAVLSVKAVGLDFAGVDVIWNDKQKKAYVLEVNTAPGIEGQTVVNYAKAMWDMINEQEG